MSFPTIGKAFSQHFMSYAHIFMNICYLGVFIWVSWIVLLDVLDALLSAWFLLLKFSILLRVGEVWFASKQVYTVESTVLGRTRKIYRQDIVQFI